MERQEKMLRVGEPLECRFQTVEELSEVRRVGKSV